MRMPEPTSPFHIGLRILKTGLAALICLFFSRGLGGFPFFAVVAALISMKPTLDDSFMAGMHRLSGTVFGGVSAMILLWILHYFKIASNSIPYDIVVVAVMMVLIKTVVLLHRSDITVLTCVVYTSIVLLPLGDQSILQYSLMRIVDTLLGVVVALSINELLPVHHLPINYKDSQKSPQDK